MNGNNLYATIQHEFLMNHFFIVASSLNALWVEASLQMVIKMEQMAPLTYKKYISKFYFLIDYKEPIFNLNSSKFQNLFVRFTS